MSDARHWHSMSSAGSNLRHRYLLRLASAFVGIWSKQAGHRKNLRAPLHKLAARICSRLLRQVLCAFCHLVHGGAAPHGHRRMMLLAWAWHELAEEALVSGHACATHLMRRVLGSWRAYLCHWRHVASTCARFSRVWSNIRMVLLGKQVLGCWLEHVRVEQARESDLENLLEYFNKDLEAAAACVRQALQHWCHIASLYTTYKADKALGHLRVRVKRKALHAWYVRAATKHRLRQSRAQFAAHLDCIVSAAHAVWCASCFLHRWRGLNEEWLAVLSQLEPLLHALAQRRRLKTLLRYLNDWRTCMAMLVAHQLMQVRQKTSMCHCWAAWQLALQDAPILYAQLWQEAIQSHAHALMRAACLGYVFTCLKHSC